MSHKTLYIADPQVWKTVLVVCGFAGLLCLITMRLYQLQVVEGDELRYKAASRAARSWTLPAARGDIYDREGHPLAASVASWTVFADPEYMTDKLQACVAVHAICGVPRATLRAAFEKQHNGLTLVKHINDVQRAAIQELNMNGVYVRRSFERVYPSGSIAPQVVGYVLDSGVGGAGIEQHKNNLLTQINGTEEFSVDGKNRPMYDKPRSKTLGKNGANVVLTIDVHLQKKAQDILATTMAHHQARTGTIILMNPHNGEILAMASWPTFDLTKPRGSDKDVYRNQAIHYNYESGSTMKPLVAAAAIADKKVRIDTSIFCENGIFTKVIGRGKRRIRDHSYKHGGHQHLTVLEGLAVSDNILMAKIGIMLGPERLHHWVHDQWRFGQRTGIELPSENKGIIRSKNQWDILGSCMSIPMGHEIAVTPLQMIVAHCAVANGGIWRPPHIIKNLYHIDADSVETQISLDEPLATERRVLPPQVADDIRRAMHETMISGTGRKHALSRWTSAGKTGTTENLVDVLVNGRIKKVYSKTEHTASFVCFAPAGATTRSAFVAFAVIDTPTKNGYYGAQAAAPAVKELLEYALERAHVPADKMMTTGGRR